MGYVMLTLMDYQGTRLRILVPIGLKIWFWGLSHWDNKTDYKGILLLIVPTTTLGSAQVRD